MFTFRNPIHVFICADFTLRIQLKLASETVIVAKTLPRDEVLRLDRMWPHSAQPGPVAERSSNHGSNLDHAATSLLPHTSAGVPYRGRASLGKRLGNPDKGSGGHPQRHRRRQAAAGGRAKDTPL